MKTASLFCATGRRGALVFAALVSICLPDGCAAASPATTVPELFVGEMEDVGPQYLLLAAPRTPPLELWSEFELTATSNATLVETNPKSSTITSVQAGGTWHLPRRARWGGQLALETGFRFQTYRYGLLSGTKQIINFLEIDRNNFDLLGAHLQAAWQRGGWLAATALRGAAMRNRGNNRVFYQEGALEWQIFRQWRSGAGRSWTAGFDGAARWSHTDSFGLLPPGWNNRVESAFVAVLDQGMGARWRVQPALRVQATHYTYPDRSRDDVHGSARVSLIYALSPTAELRLGVGYDRRDSSDPLIPDFRKWDAGLAGGARWRF